MRKNDFAELLTTFLTSYLPNFKNVSNNTIASYCDTFKIFLRYCRDDCNIPVEKITLDSINDELIEKFLLWLERERHCSISTRNQRLMAFRSFFRYIQAEAPQYILSCQKVLHIPTKRKEESIVNYLTKEELQILLTRPNSSSSMGRRDLVMLCLLYDTGARVQELADLTPRDVRIEYPAHVRLMGKGRKAREVPLLSNTAKLLQNYLHEHRLLTPEKASYPLFANRYGVKMTRSGIAYILEKYAAAAKEECSTFPEHISPHVLRHTKAMHLLQADVNIVYIRDILGHASVNTTQIYASADTRMKRIALEKLGDTPTPVVPSWVADTDLLTWLQGIGKQK
jgi:site-specific recombinase XerD